MPSSIYQYSNLAPRLSEQTSIFRLLLNLFSSLFGNSEIKKNNNTKCTIWKRKPGRHVSILIHPTWPIRQSRDVLTGL